MNRNRNDEPEPKARFTSRFLNKSKSTGLAPADEEDFVPVSSGRRYSGNDDSFYTSRRDPGYSALKERKTRLARSKSTHGFGEDADIELDDSTPLSYYPASYLASKTSNSGNDLSRSRSSHVLKSRENSPERPLSNAGIVYCIFSCKQTTTHKRRESFFISPNQCLSTLLVWLTVSSCTFCKYSSVQIVA